MVTLPAVPQAPAQASRWRQLTAGITVARQDKVVGRCLVTVFLFSLLALAFIGQMPVVAAHNLGINLSKSADYGILYACFGMGALVGAISIGTVFASTSKPLLVRVCLVGYSLALCAFALQRSPMPADVNVAVTGAFYFAFITALNTTLQARVHENVRGRVMALWMMGFGGTVGVGNLLIGPVVAAVGITNVLLFGAGVALAPGLVRRRAAAARGSGGAGGRAGPVGLAQRLLVELAVLPAGQGVGEVDRARALVVRQVGPAEGDDLGLELGAGREARGGLDDRLDLLAHLRLGDAEDGHVGHRGVQHEDVLDLLGVDVHAARHDHEQLAVGQVQVALVVEVADVPERGPALVVERLARLLGVVVVLEGRVAARRRSRRRRPRRSAAPPRRRRRRAPRPRWPGPPSRGGSGPPRR